jgi:amino acid transporter
MKINKKNPKQTMTVIAILAFIAVLIALGVTYYVLSGYSSNQSNLDNKPFTNSTIDDTTPVVTTPNNLDSKSTDQNQTDTSQDGGKATATITSANQNDGILQIRVLIESVTTNGTCSLTLSKQGEQSVSRETGIQALASTSTCKGFDVPVSELSNGVWNIDISITIASTTTLISKKVTVQ